jgi:hypothetical protein
MADGTAQTLAALLAPYADPELAGRLVDVPPEVGAEALALLPPDLRTARLNLSQPPMSWLVDVAVELGGRLVGSLAAGRAFARFDGVQVSSSRARHLAVRISEAWPETADAPAALPAATAEAWTEWTATWPIWSGTGADLLSARLPQEAAVLGVVWD